MTQRLHKFSIKEVLQSQSKAEKHNIHFPRLEAHHKKLDTAGKEHNHSVISQMNSYTTPLRRLRNKQKKQ